ncbi:HutD family protein [Rhodoferax sp.]|uniref:HutD/Ves family protein n=1 Tax=Rhodoferax sp. TaxID=50421 RepID=UPI002762673A|nr:HutD family protein [Rhodoferax sp.]
MSFECIDAAAVAPQAWRNGGGQTRELLAWPSAEAWTLRISLADIRADGPFSSFAGVQRWFAVVQGAGVQLKFTDATYRIGLADEPLCFDGVLTPGCALLGGATRDLNLMLRGAPGHMRRLHGALGCELDAPVLIAIYAVSMPAAVQFGDEVERVVAPGTLVWRLLDAPGRVRAQGDDALWLEAKV